MDRVGVEVGKVVDACERMTGDGVGEAQAPSKPNTVERANRRCKLRSGIGLTL